MLPYIIIAVVTVIALVGISWLQVKADQDRAARGEPKKHNEQIITVISFDHHKD